MTPKLGFAFALGAILGCGLMLAFGIVGQGAEDAPQTSGAAIPAPPSKPLPSFVSVDPASSDAELAERLTLAEFDRTWAPVGAVAKVLRERKPSAQGGEAPRSVAAVASRSLSTLDYTYREQIESIQLAGRDNPATRLVRSGATQEQITQGLKELLLAPQLSDRDRQVQRDAALLLARHPDPLARRILLDVLEQPDLFELAANALARAHDPEADRILLAVVEGDQDPLRRSAAAGALALTQNLANGGSVADGLSRVARGDLDVTVRSHAIAALARTDLDRCASARTTLLELLSDTTEVEPVRQASLAALQAQLMLSHRLPPAVVETLEVLANTERSPLRREIVATLGKAGGTRTVELFEALLPSLPTEDRGAVQAALDELKRRVVPE